MSKEREESPSLPVACSLTPAEFKAMRQGLLPGLLASASAKDAIPGGFRWRFDPRAGLLRDAAAVIEAEHGCCRFLRFVLLVEPGDGPLYVEVTGPEGTQQFLSALLATLPAGSDEVRS